jgi:hypothetical protein
VSRPVIFTVHQGREEVQSGMKRKREDRKTEYRIWYLK